MLRDATHRPAASVGLHVAEYFQIPELGPSDLQVVDSVLPEAFPVQVSA